MTYAFLSTILGSQLIGSVVNTLEYAPHVNKDWDPYSVVHKVSHASQRFMTFCYKKKGCVAQPPADSDRWLDSKKVPGADTSRSLGECVGPAGYEFSCSG